MHSSQLLKKSVDSKISCHFNQQKVRGRDCGFVGGEIYWVTSLLSFYQCINLESVLN